MDHSWTELDLDALGRNLDGVLAAMRAPTEMILVVKSDAYGHGMLPVARAAAGRGVRRLASVHVEEAVRLRAALPEADILMMGVLSPEEVPIALERRIVPVIVDEEHGEALAAAAGRRRLVCHAKIDTGMSRLGIPWRDAAAVLARLSRRANLSFAGLCSHFASADEPDRQCDVRAQAERFQAVVEACRREGIEVPFRHISNSGGIQNVPACDFDAVRCGILAYGYPPAGARVATSPCLQWKTRIVQVKRVAAGAEVGYGATYRAPADTLLATLDVGYADGYCRRIGNRGVVLVGGRRVPVAGRVSMNLVTADLGPGGTARAGDEAVLLGRQGGVEVWAGEMASWCDTIPYEVLTSIRPTARYTISGGQRSPTRS